MTESSSIRESVAPTAEAVHDLVRGAYDRIARGTSGSCCSPSCCGGTSADADADADRDAYAESRGYSAAERAVAPNDANLGLGCGNPTALAELSVGEVVVDLGAGAGFDAFIAADRVGPTGRVLGVDMTPGMLERSRRLAVEHGVAGFVEFREGLVEDLPIAGNTADVVLSNCVINLVPDKARAFREAFRVLKPGGRLAVSDILLSEALRPESRAAADLYVGCVAGAVVADEYLEAIDAAGFVDVSYTRAPAAFLGDSAPAARAAAVEQLGEEHVRDELGKVWSYHIRARKP